MNDDMPPLPPSRPNQPFDPDTLDKSVIALPLLVRMEADEKAQGWYQELRNLLADPATSPPDSLDLRPLAPVQEWLANGQHAQDVAWWQSLPADLRAVWQRKAAAGELTEWLAWLQRLFEAPAEAALPQVFSVIIDLNLQHPAGRRGARDWVVQRLNELSEGVLGAKAEADPKNEFVQQYLFVRLMGRTIRALVDLDTRQAPADEDSANPQSTKKPLPGHRAMYRIWPDFPINPLMNKSIATVKADAAQVSYAASGEGMVWAVLDSGIDGSHRHFAEYQNLDVAEPLKHTDFTGSAGGPLADGLGHGTHVAGIIAGGLRNPDPAISAYSRQRNGAGVAEYVPVAIPHISGIAPKCKLLSLRVMDDKGQGEASNLIAALTLIQELNGYGRNILIHGVNMSVGYTFEPEWFACGQSPLCVEVNRLVRSGVVVVVAAGNTGYGLAQSKFNGTMSAGMSLTINDPGNADLAITVGSTHRDMPHVYGVSYFSSKGPTGDGRLKPDLVAPGEKILSCAAGSKLAELTAKGKPCDYLEQSGTSMAAPHVSGAVAAFLSIRREFIGFPEQVKALFVNSATDLKRERYFQGAGLVDLMRAIQSV